MAHQAWTKHIPVVDRYVFRLTHLAPWPDEAVQPLDHIHYLSRQMLLSSRTLKPMLGEHLLFSSELCNSWVRSRMRSSVSHYNLQTWYVPDGLTWHTVTRLGWGPNYCQASKTSSSYSLTSLCKFHVICLMVDDLGKSFVGDLAFLMVGFPTGVRSKKSFRSSMLWYSLAIVLVVVVV